MTSAQLLTVLAKHFGAIETSALDPLDAVILRDLKPDSLDVVEVLMEIEDHFQIAITDDEVMGLGEDTTLRDLLALVEGKLGVAA